MTDIVTLEQYKSYMGISSVNQNEIIAQLIPQITAYIKTYCERDFVEWYATDKVEIYNGGFSTIYPKEFPLVSVTSLEYSTDYGATYTALINFTDFAVDYENDCIVPINQCVFPKKLNAYKLTYKAGYPTYPKELQLAAMDLITYYIRNDTAVKSTRSAGSNTTQIEYVLNAGLPSNIRRVLDLYKVV